MNGHLQFDGMTSVVIMTLILSVTSGVLITIFILSGKLMHRAHERVVSLLTEDLHRNRAERDKLRDLLRQCLDLISVTLKKLPDLQPNTHKEILRLQQEAFKVSSSTLSTTDKPEERGEV